jgi:hypothetical protein
MCSSVTFLDAWDVLMFSAARVAEVPGHEKSGCQSSALRGMEAGSYCMRAQFTCLVVSQRCTGLLAGYTVVNSVIT